MKATILGAIVFISVVVNGQSPVGLWEVVKVTVGTKTVTPVGKWTRVNEDGTFQSGNGWQQNSEGKWSFDKTTGEYIPDETNGIEDPYGSFRAVFKRDTMYWHRDEDGAPVVVTWIAVKTIPRAPADLIVGVWELDTLVKESVYAVEEKRFLFIRWDRVWVGWNSEREKRYGFWFMNAHRPELSLINQDDSGRKELWRVDVSANELVLTGVSEKNNGAVLSFRRVHRLPD